MNSQRLYRRLNRRRRVLLESKQFFRNGPPAPVRSREAGILLKEMIMREMFEEFMRDEEGVTAIEYGLIAALIAVVIIGSVTLVGNNLDNVFNYIAGKLTTP